MDSLSTNGPARVFAILDLFSEQHPVWTGDEIGEALGYSRPSAYRYIRTLLDAGLLHKARSGVYVLGPRIVQLDYQMRQTDPVLRASREIMDTLAQETGLIVVLSAMSGDIFFDIHFANRPDQAIPFVYTRGRRRPWSQGAAPKVFLSHLTKPMLGRIHETYRDELVAGGMGETFAAFRKYLAPIGKSNFYFSRGELWGDVDGIAAAIRNNNGEPQASLAFAGRSGRLEEQSLERLRMRLMEVVRSIEQKLP